MSISALKSDLLELGTNARKMAEELERQDDQAAAQVMWANIEMAIMDTLSQIDSIQADYRASVVTSERNS